MPDHWIVHLADARGRLSPKEAEIRDAIDRAEARVLEAGGMSDIDIIVEDIPGGVIEEMGLAGFSPSGWTIRLICDPGNPNFEGNLGEPLERMIAHEANHTIRWRTQGYGRTLGEALVTEGLAGRYVHAIFDSAPEIFEAPRDGDLDALGDALEQWAAPYDHAEWFFGTKDRPMWLGYRLGYRIVAQHIAATGTPVRELTDAPAAEFKDSARRLAA
ncbi:Predicted Zn-dependent protease [Roseivivax halotolerans]|uniref:Predicted Zn-dependent protease n=1 Tax=Roseivivax halotolerans TaxID=93684 RepID=A0A1I5X9Q0_9RHOB|nr:DUF2268 domain-containing putative Zn-dependent protease [Roseivivax halotolerans]SFQ28709.1 Predicted Zn-dependent protease [Roseivivax halotolerans]